MKRIIAILLMMVILNMLVVGCVSRQNYETLTVEYDGLRARVESLQNEIQTLQSDLAAEQSKSVRLESDLEGAQARNSELTSSLEKAESELQAGSAELTAGVQKIQAELQAVQDKVSELTFSLEKVENELETTKSEYEAFKSEVESLLLLSYDQHTALQTASLDVHSAVEAHDYEAFSGAGATVKGILADLNDVKAAKLQSLWKEAYNKPPVYTYHGWGLIYGLFDDFQRLNRERTRAIRKVLDIYYHGWLER